MAINNNFEFNFSSDDWNDQSSYMWSEQSGRKYLLEVSKETEKFYNLYIRLRHIANHLDFIFATMLWKHIQSKAQNLNNDFKNDVNINTFHCNPLNIAFVAIFAFVENILEIALKANCSLSTLKYFYLHQLVNKVAFNQQQGIYSMDSGDYVLAICHFKNILSIINKILALLKEISLKSPQKKENTLNNFLKDFNIAIFDLRELSWQAISLCNAISEN